jgi:ATP-dependent Clp protease ATP-binding subunit ClpX
MLHINTENILFICGGAFDGLEKINEERMDKKSIGFDTEIEEKKEHVVDELFSETMPQDLVKFGLIPEFIGRVPVTVALKYLDKEAMVRVLKEPKNSLVKQYKKLFEIDGVDLEFTDGALEAVAEKSFERKTGARGLRAIMEDVLMDIMYKVPSDDSIGRVTVDENVVKKGEDPKIDYRTDKVQPTKRSNIFAGKTNEKKVVND